MANSKIGNYRLEFFVSGFTSPTRTHVVGAWVLPTTAPSAGALPTDIDIQLKGGGTKNLQEVANQLGSFLRTFYAGAVSMTSYTLWRYATEFSRDFISAGTAVLTTAGSGSISVAHQQTVTMRCAGGAIMKTVIMEGNIAGNVIRTLTPNASGDIVERLAAYYLSVDGAAVGLDNTFPVAALRDAREENEFWQGKIYRG